MQVTLDTHSKKEGKKTNQGTAEATPTVSVCVMQRCRQLWGFRSSPVAPQASVALCGWALAGRKLALEEKVLIQRLCSSVLLWSQEQAPWRSWGSEQADTLPAEGIGRSLRRGWGTTTWVLGLIENRTLATILSRTRPGACFPGAPAAL